MQNESQNNKASIGSEIRKVWSKITDQDIALYEDQPDQFFLKLKEKHGVSQEDAQKRLKAMKTACGSCGTQKAA